MNKVENSICLLFLLVISVSFTYCGDSQTGVSNNNGGDGVRECNNNAQCDPGLFCTPDGRCVEKCASDNDCTDSKCDTIRGICVQCTLDNDCLSSGADAYCDMDYNVCKVGCDCKHDQVCVNGRCQKVQEDGDQNTEIEQEVESNESEIEIANCEPGPDGKLCIPGCSECKDGTDSISKLCNEQGSSYTQKLCPSGTVCSQLTGTCGEPVCDPYSTVCVENSVRECNESGTLYSDRPCQSPTVCHNGACVNMACSDSIQTRLYNFDVHSEIASPDRKCNYPINIGSAKFAIDDVKAGIVEFDGVSAMMSLPAEAIDFTEEITLAVTIWINNDTNTNSTIIQKGDPASFKLSIEDLKVVFRISTQEKQRVLTGTKLSYDAWHNIVATYDGENMRLYINGKIIGDPVSVPKEDLDSNDSPVYIGAGLDKDELFTGIFSGKLDNLYFAEKAISDEAVEFFYDNADLCPLGQVEKDSTYCKEMCERTVVTHDAKDVWGTEDKKVEMYAGETVYLYPGGCAYAGSELGCTTAEGVSGKNCDNCQKTDADKYCLLGKFGAIGVPFAVPGKQALYSSRKQDFYFGFNDEHSMYKDNKGGFATVIERGYCRISKCPNGMVGIDSRLMCVDRYEASCNSSTSTQSNCALSQNDAAESLPGKIPWTNISAEDAETACGRSGKKLCKAIDWKAVCQGEDKFDYPYGDTYSPEACNDSQIVTTDELVPTGQFNNCATKTGVFDLSGNAYEFVKLLTGNSYSAMAGKSQSSSDGSECLDKLEDDTKDPARNIGFRCCKDAEPR